MKKFAYFLLLVLIPSLSFSKSIDIKTLEIVAKKAFTQRIPNYNPLLDEISIKEISFVIESNDTLIALFQFSNDGFIILSADDVISPVLAYSIENGLDINNLAPGVKYWLEVYKNEIITLKDLNQNRSEEVIAAWESLLSSNFKGTTSVVVNPLITAKWNQDKYYNQYSPKDNGAPSGYDNRVPVGCVALAMSMIMYYYRYPATGQGSHTNFSDYGSHAVNFAQQTYDYNAMSDELNSYNNEVAKLIYHCATSVDMMYAADGSGAYSQEVVGAVKNYFKYANNVSLLDRSNYTQANWLTQIKTSLNNKKPVYYAGSSTEGGHAFVCDGYDSDDLCHFNFGWGGSGNGYFAVGTSGTSIGGYYGSQKMIINFYPSALPTINNTTTIINATSGTLEDGSRVINYSNNMNITYVIAPANATSFSINIQTLKSELGIDTLSFWKGNPSNGLLVGSFSGNVSNSNINIQTDSLFITFKSNDNTTDEGWRIYYKVTTSNIACSQVQIFTQASATFSDGSALGVPYASETECIFQIRPTGAQNITLTFNRLDLSSEDLIEVYDITTSNRQHLDTYSGTTLPNVKTYPYRKIQVNFKSDNKIQNDGFEITYSINTDIQESENQMFTIFPNPASQQITLEFQNPMQESSLCEIFDMMGKRINTYSLDQQESQIDISSLPSGIYLIQFKTSQGNYTRKFIKN